MKGLTAVRKCKRCSYEGDKTSFPVSRTLPGRVYYRHVCTECWNKQKKARINTNKAIVDQLRKDAECMICGNDDWRVIDWHHVDPSNKNFNVASGRAQGFPIERLLKEIEKCTPLCSNCHRVVEYEIRHGSVRQMESEEI